jgi:hypothetical protein
MKNQCLYFTSVTQWFNPFCLRPIRGWPLLLTSFCALLDKHVSIYSSFSVVIPGYDPLANLTW